MESKNLPIVLITNDDGIDATGLRALVDVLVSSSRYIVHVSAPDSDKSGVGHGITWQHPVSVQQVPIEGATAYAISGTPADCANLGISEALFPGAKPNLVISGINIGSNCGYHIVYSGTVAGAREAFLCGVPSLAISYSWKEGKSNIHDLRISAELCLPIIDAILSEVENKTYLQGYFLNIDFPTDVAHHKGFKITKQGKTMIKLGWKQIIPSTATANMKTGLPAGKEVNASSDTSQGQRLFKRAVAELQYEFDETEDTDTKALHEGYVTITPIGALSKGEVDAEPYFKNWLLLVDDKSSSSAL